MVIVPLVVITRE